MSNEYDPLFDDSETDSKLVKQLRAEIEKRDKALKDVEEKLSKLEVAERQKGLAESLAAKGLSPKVAKFIPTDILADQAAVDSWLEENGDAFAGVGQPAGQAATQEQAPTPTEDQIKMARFDLEADTPVTVAGDYQDRINSATSVAEVLAAMGQIRV